MYVSDAHLDQVRYQGFTVVPGFLDKDELAAAQETLWLHYPRPDSYFADPDAHAWLNAHAFAGLKLFPFKAWTLNRIACHPDLVDAAERLLESHELDLHKVELRGKYSGVLHRGSDITVAGRSRFALLADYQVRGHPWAGNRSVDVSPLSQSTHVPHR